MSGIDPISNGLAAATEALRLASKLTPTLSQKELQAIRQEYETSLAAIEYHLNYNPDGSLRVPVAQDGSSGDIEQSGQDHANRGA